MFYRNHVCTVFWVSVLFVSLSSSYTKIMASPIFGKQFLVIFMVNNLTCMSIYIYIYMCVCVGQFCPVFQLCERKGPAQYPVWGEMNFRGHPAEEWTKLPSEERWSMFVRNWAVSEDDGHLGTFVRGAWWTC